jgi:hypothetical protein
MKIITSIMVISCMILLSLSAAACDTEPSQTTSTESTTTDNQSILTISGSWASYYANMEELSREADLIAYGEIDRVIEVQEQIVGHNPKGDMIHYYTNFNFKISQVLKGDGIEEAVIHQMGAAGKMVVPDDPMFKKGEEYVLFLHKTETGIYFVLGGPQGRFMVDGGKVFSMDNIIGDKVFLSDDLSYNGIELDDFMGDISKELK